ncbi:MAG: hypothetical protein U1G07_09895 [Verrucomicrobiota bacterium]
MKPENLLPASGGGKARHSSTMENAAVLRRLKTIHHKFKEGNETFGLPRLLKVTARFPRPLQLSDALLGACIAYLEVRPIIENWMKMPS